MTHYYVVIKYGEHNHTYFQYTRNLPAALSKSLLEHKEALACTMLEAEDGVQEVGINIVRQNRDAQALEMNRERG